MDINGYPLGVGVGGKGSVIAFSIIGMDARMVGEGEAKRTSFRVTSGGVEG